MNKAQGLYDFWNSFGVPAYEENTVSQKAKLPYITYEAVFDDYQNTVSASASIWYYGKSWEDADLKAEQISKEIGLGGVIKRLTDGFLWVKKDTPFAQHGSDPDDMIRKVRLGVEYDFLTED